jgi:hypothetical protein
MVIAPRGMCRSGTSVSTLQFLEILYDGVHNTLRLTYMEAI